jgi:hypothetical protein
MITLLVAGLLLVTVGAGGNMARAGEGCGCGTNCGGGLFHRAEFVPNVTYFVPYPYWFPNYFNVPPYTDYQVVQYVTPPEVTAAMVKDRILAINAANPALLPMAKEPLPFPKVRTPKSP